MRAVIQRVTRATVQVENELVGAIEAGLLVYAAAAPNDTDADIRYIADKLTALRIFPDEAGKLNRSLVEVGGAVLLVSAFTVLADARRGRRPSFDNSAPAETAQPLIENLAAAIRAHALPVQTGRFAAHMQVQSTNTGPICILLDSRRVF
jgi:D-tyrosyl-tRNA(Tyr) deacylase